MTCLFFSVCWLELVTCGLLVAGKEWEEMWMSSGKLEGKRRSWRGGGDSKGDREEMFRGWKEFQEMASWNPRMELLQRTGRWPCWDSEMRTGNGIYMEMICNLEESNLLLSCGKAWLKWVKERWWMEKNLRQIQTRNGTDVGRRSKFETRVFWGLPWPSSG